MSIYYTESHEWVGEDGRVGVTLHAQKEVGNIVYVDLPKVGQFVRKGEEICVLESTKAAADVYSPVSGTVISVNETARKDPGIINRAAEGIGWLFQLVLSNPSEQDTLLSEHEYQKIICSHTE